MSFGGLLLIITKTHVENLEKRRKEELEASELRYALIVEAANDGLWDWDLKTNTIYYSPRWKEMLGYEENEISNTPEEWFSRIHPDDRNISSKYLSQVSDKENPAFEYEYRLRHKEEHYLWVLTRGKTILNDTGIPIRTVGSHSNITSRKEAEKQLQYDSLHDALTDLPNRILLLDRLQRAIRFSERDGIYQYAVLFLDLDNFKDINDTLGHDTGDQILVECASRIKSCARNVDTVSRLGGDEFVILLEGIDDDYSPIGIAQRISDELALPFKILQTEIRLTTSIGIVFGNSTYTTANALLRDSDIAMYQAKGAGRAKYEIFDPKMRQKITERIKAERELAQAIQNHDFKLTFQPIVSLETGHMLGLEALVRWHHPQRGIIQPDDFIPIAEETGLILEIGNWVLEEACNQLVAWDQIFPQAKQLSISVNISGQQITNPGFFDLIVSILQKTKLEPNRLHLEITENTIVEDVEQTLHTITKISSLGVELHLDDFGTGYSSIAYLHRFPVKALKIDKSFIARLEHQENGNGHALVRGIINLANTLNLDVIAEGIEYSEQFTFLKELNCGQGQGFYASKPVYKEDMELILAEQRKIFTPPKE
ncbi:MAG: EAL domain-containing protein [Anaerolineae bacterium]|jgi:diguanylate cyclase (GGDEF)-like protein/PAS domain S-box-containing protein|nr:EAL domain-containing protein [Anaerolineae bacterium]MBT3713628.1 EAL domain-containing protein [Anaerolineae bacterium]MBT4309479.1 EAL domain-containing protein [Anaerolineae bacterium]MBT4459469.1 EAL domain-containing protein [Anaerolineae bacterium]MBT4842393.1 EAL domain-containing protein [Anaerolineae bacterium]